MESSRKLLQEKIIQIEKYPFEELALEVFRFQATHNTLYQQFLKLIQVKVHKVERITQIPHLPISFFKQHSIKTGLWQEAQIFTSSGTTGSVASRHFVRSPEWYFKLARKSFEKYYGPLDEFQIFALLPNYLERSGSSLVAMANDFIQHSNSEKSGFYLYNYEELKRHLSIAFENKTKVLLLGVSFALWDFAEQFPMDLSGAILMETGGMKGRKKEITRQELHAILQTAFQLDKIHSEYGMTELFSQAYSKGEGIFYPAETMRVWTREITDPFQAQTITKTGVLNIVDLANLDTISFIATDDLGRCFPDYSFEVLGRLDASDIRGCNLLVAD